ncbi:MAG TPA: tryptophan synthase subunit alpha [Spirochaetia bacterium]|nr:tryptophan synthase subunit alpha [Spirochaetia bacterium]
MSGERRIMAHMVAYFPDRAASRQVARGLVDGGCAYLEIQFPFSDPTADGPDIQAACTEALAAGFTIQEGFRLVSEIRQESPSPIFLMSYANLLFTHGIDRFLARCAECGVAGVIVPDLPPDYDEGLFGAARAHGLHAVPVLSPSMREERLMRIAKLHPEYVYATLRTGTTGPLTRIDEVGIAFLERVKTLCSDPPAKVLGGFGISTSAQVAGVAGHAHAVIVGSALVREVAKGGDPYASVLGKMRELVLDREVEAGQAQGGAKARRSLRAD